MLFPEREEATPLVQTFAGEVRKAQPCPGLKIWPSSSSTFHGACFQAVWPGI